MNDTTRSVPPSRVEIGQLLAIAERDLEQSRMLSLHLDTRYSVAYNAALQLATAFLHLHGVRIRKTRFHQHTFAELRTRLPENMRGFADYFDRVRRKRNIATYDQANVISAGEVTDLIQQVEVFQAWVVEETGRHRLDTVGG
jgi:uncharacterized protein (UPF0332 family)